MHTSTTNTDHTLIGLLFLLLVSGIAAAGVAHGRRDSRLQPLSLAQVHLVWLTLSWRIPTARMKKLNFFIRAGL